MFSAKQAQAIEDGRGVRFKFAGIGEGGHLVGDAWDEYEPLLGDLPGGWRSEDLERMVHTRTEHERTAYYVTDGDEEILVVEHETGIEFLLDIGVEVASAAVIALISASWARWRTLRKESPHVKVDSSLVIEIPRTRGKKRLEPIRVVVPPPVKRKQIAHYYEAAAMIADGSTRRGRR